MHSKKQKLAHYIEKYEEQVSKYPLNKTYKRDHHKALYHLGLKLSNLNFSAKKISDLLKNHCNEMNQDNIKNVIRSLIRYGKAK